MSQPPNGILIGSTAFCTAHWCAHHTDIHKTQTTIRATPVKIGGISSTAWRRCGL